MGKKKSKKNNRRIAGQKTTQKNTHLIVEQVGNGHGIPTSAPGLAAVMSEPKKEVRVVTARAEEVSRNKGKNTEKKSATKSSSPKPDEHGKMNDNRLEEKEKYVTATYVASIVVTAKEGSPVSNGNTNNSEWMEETPRLSENSIPSPQREEAQLSPESSTRLKKLEAKSSLSKASCLFSQAEKVLAPSSEKRPTTLLSGQERRTDSKGQDTRVPSPEEELRSVTENKEPSVHCSGQDSGKPVVLLSENERTIVSEKLSDPSSKRKDSETSKSPKKTEILEILNEAAQATTTRDNFDITFETTINEASLGSLLDIPALHGRNSRIDALKQDVISNKTQHRQHTKGANSHVSAVVRGHHPSERTEEKLISPINVNVQSEMREKAKNSSEQGSTADVGRQEIPLERESCKESAPSRRGEACKSIVTKHRTLKETYIRSQAPKTVVRNANEEAKELGTSTSKAPGTDREKIGITRISQRETLKSSHTTDAHRGESRNTLRMGERSQKHGSRTGSTKRPERGMTKNSPTTQSQDQGSNHVENATRSEGKPVPSQSETSKPRSQRKSQVRASKANSSTGKHKKDSKSPGKYQDVRRKSLSAMPRTTRGTNRQSMKETRGKGSGRSSLFPVSMDRRAGTGVDESDSRRLENVLISNTIFQVMETVQNKIARECFVEKEAGRKRSCSSTRK